MTELHGKICGKVGWKAKIENGQITGIPEHLMVDFNKVMKTLELDKNDENVEKAVNVAQTNYKLRNKKEEGKNMKLDKAGLIHMLYICKYKSLNNN